MIDLQDEGINDIRKRLLEQAEGLQKKAVRSGLVYGSQPLKAAMRTLAPSLTGALSRSIGHRQLSDTAKSRAGVAQGVEAILVGPQKVRLSARQIGQGLTASRNSGEAWLVHILEETGAKPHRVYAGANKPGNAKRNARLVKKFGAEFAAQKIAGRKRALKIHGFPYGAANVRGFRPKKFIAGALDVAGAQMSERFWQGVTRYLDRKAD
jgi:hypothetical protein